MADTQDTGRSPDGSGHSAEPEPISVVSAAMAASVPNAIPTIAYWMGAPVSEMPREELEREFCRAHERIRQLELEICDRSIAHVQDLAAMGKARLHEKHRLLRWMGVS